MKAPKFIWRSIKTFESNYYTKLILVRLNVRQVLLPTTLKSFIVKTVLKAMKKSDYLMFHLYG